MYIIYTIQCPISLHVVYVGSTNNFEQRKYQHTHGYGSCDINRWEKGLLKRGLKPIVEPIDVYPDSHNFFDVEVYWIGQMIQWGFKLFNSEHDFAKRTRPKTQRYYRRFTNGMQHNAFTDVAAQPNE